MKLHLGQHEVSTNNVLKEIRSSTLEEGLDVLKTRLAEDGYLCLRGLIPRDAVLKARSQVYAYFNQHNVLSADSSLELIKGKVVGIMGNKDVTHHPDFLNCVEHQHCFDFFNGLFGESSMTFDYKWARGVQKGEAGTGAHCDVVYMGQGSERLHTMWTPLGDIPRENGPMALLENSHRHPSLQKVRDTYGKMDVDRDLISGWFSQNYVELSEKTGCKWLIGDYQAGDVVIFGMHFMHGSFRNELDAIRLTCDVRFQPASDPVDDRWIGTSPRGHYRWGEAQKTGHVKSMEYSQQLAGF